LLFDLIARTVASTDVEPSLDPVEQIGEHGGGSPEVTLRAVATQRAGDNNIEIT
jgi:hypothetical protein